MLFFAGDALGLRFNDIMVDGLAVGLLIGPPRDGIYMFNADSTANDCWLK